MERQQQNNLTRRKFLLQASAGSLAMACTPRGGTLAGPDSGRSEPGQNRFRIRALDRRYDLHRPRGCTLLAIEVADWPGNEFGLWLPEAIYSAGEVVWGNWRDDAHQDFQQDAQGRWITTRALQDFTVTSTLTPDPANSCLWYRHSFHNTGRTTLHGLNTQTCFHLVNAPQFISLGGSRLWANLDGNWTTTDRVPRDRSPDPRRVWFLKQGLRSERTVVPIESFPSAIMPQAAHHPLFIAENFTGTACAGIASRNFKKLFNNNDAILRCLHSESLPIQHLDPGQTAHLDTVILLVNGNHNQAVEHYKTRIAPNWPAA